ncbi:MAG: hypothetical protein ACLP9K_04340, partial [Nitrososphaerales archaeon]
PWRLDLYHPSQLRSQARSRKRELYAMKQGLEAHDLQSWEDVTEYNASPRQQPDDRVVWTGSSRLRK